MTTPETGKAADAKPNTVDPKVVAAVKAPHSFNPVWLVATLAAVIFFAWIAYDLGSTRAGKDLPQPSVIVIDVGLLQLAKKQELQEQLASYEAVMREVDVFANDLQQILSAYRDAGIVVINKNAIVATPGSLDVTELVADRLRIKLPQTLR